MRISDWSSDVCSSDLEAIERAGAAVLGDQMHVRSSAEIDVRAGTLQVEADAGATINSYVGADIKGAFADDVIAGLQSGFAAACPGNATTVDSRGERRSEEHTSELQSLMPISYAVFCLQ